MTAKKTTNLQQFVAMISYKRIAVIGLSFHVFFL